MLLALELRPDAVLAHALDDGGLPQFARQRALDRAATPAQRWLQLIEAARDVCAGVQAEPSQCARIALVFPGALRPDGRVAAGGALASGGFAGYDLRRGLREHLGSGEAELVVASASVAEAWAQSNAGALRGADNWLYLGLGDDIESVACARGAWLRADVGALVVERDGILDGQGRRGTLRAYCAGREFTERARSYSLNVEPREIWELAPANFAARSLADDYVSRLAQGLAGAVALLAPQIICIGGAQGRAIFALIQSDLASELRDYLGNDLWNGALVAAAPGDAGAVAPSPGALTLATLGAPPL